MDRNIPRVQQMYSNAGNAVPNQLLIYTDDGVYFQSYSTIRAFKDYHGNVVLDADSWDYSATTGRYRNQFLSEGIAETRRNIEEGYYTLEDLN